MGTKFTFSIHWIDERDVWWDIPSIEHVGSFQFLSHWVPPIDSWIRKKFRINMAIFGRNRESFLFRTFNGLRLLRFVSTVSFGIGFGTHCPIRQTCNEKRNSIKFSISQVIHLLIRGHLHAGSVFLSVDRFNKLKKIFVFGKFIIFLALWTNTVR